MTRSCLIYVGKTRPVLTKPSHKNARSEVASCIGRPSTIHGKSSQAGPAPRLAGRGWKRTRLN